jgi:hypothetical protein
MTYDLIAPPAGALPVLTCWPLAARTDRDRVSIQDLLLALVTRWVRADLLVCLSQCVAAAARRVLHSGGAAGVSDWDS